MTYVNQGQNGGPIKEKKPKNGKLKCIFLWGGVPSHGIQKIYILAKLGKDMPWGHHLKYHLIIASSSIENGPTRT